MTKQGGQREISNTEWKIWNAPKQCEENNKYKNKTKSTNYNKVQVIYYHLGWVGQLQFIVIHLVHKQCGCNNHTNAIRTGLHITLIYWCTATSRDLWQDNRRIFPIITFESHKQLISIWVLCNKKWLWWKQVKKTKPSNNITEHSQGKLLNRTPTDTETFLYNLSNHPKEYNLAARTGDGQK